MHIITKNIHIRYHQNMFINKNIFDCCKYIGVFLFSNDLLLLKDIQNGPRSKSGSNGESWENLVTIQNKSIASLILCYIQHLHSYQGQQSFQLCSILFFRFFCHVINIISVTSFNFSCHERYYHHNIIQTFFMLSLV